MLPTKFRFILPSSFRGEEFKKSANQKQESPVVAMLQIYASETPQPNELWKVLYKDCSFRPNPLTNMATTGDSCF
jgi:hypothetical protein